MIYYILAPRFLFSADWSGEPGRYAGVYFTFRSPKWTAGAGLLLLTYTSTELCPVPPFSEEYEPPKNPIEVEFNSTLWEERTPISPWNIPFKAFAFGNRGSYQVEVSLIEDGGREIWKLNSAGKMVCKYFQKVYYYPKRGECTFQGERQLSNLWNRYGDIADIRFLYRRVFSFEEHSNLVPPPTLLAYLPYIEGTNLYLFEYPNWKTANTPLANLLSIEKILQKEGDVSYPGWGHLGHEFQEILYLNLFYRAWDFFGPYAFALPRPEGMWIAVISKKLKDIRRVKTEEDIYHLPIWEYEARWYYRGEFQKETTIPKLSSTSFIWFAYPYLSPTGEFGLYLYEVDYLPQIMRGQGNLSLGKGILLANGRKLTYEVGSGKVPNPINLLFLPPKDYPAVLYLEDPWTWVYYLVTHPKVKHRKFTQCYSLIPPYSSAPLGHPSPETLYGWHPAGNFLMIRWDEERKRWQTYDYNGLEIIGPATDTSLPPGEVLDEILGEPGKDCVLLSLLIRPEMPSAILFWFVPEDPNFPYIFNSYCDHLYSILKGYPSKAPYQAYPPYEFCLAPQDPRPLLWGKLKMLVWRKGKGISARRNLGKYPIQYLFPSIEPGTGYLYLPLLSNMEEGGEGLFTLLSFKRNDWSAEVYNL